MEEIKELKLLARVNPTGVTINKEQSINLTPFELIGLYEFIKKQHKGESTDEFALMVKLNAKKGLIIRHKFFPREGFYIPDLFEKLKDKEIEWIQKRLEIEHE